jgi:hypothetical protein
LWERSSFLFLGVFNNPLSPNATYGFTDTVAKSGNILFTTLLYVDASRQLGALAEMHGCGDATRCVVRDCNGLPGALVARVGSVGKMRAPSVLVQALCTSKLLCGTRIA